MKWSLLVVFMIALSACGKSCEQLGGKVITDGGHMEMIFQSNGSIIPIWIANHKCVIKDYDKSNDKEIVYRVIQEDEMQPAYRNEPNQRWWEDKGNVK